MSIPDYSQFKDPAVGGNLMASFTSLADQKQAADEEVARLEALLDEAKKNQQRITEHEIPNLMDGLEGKISLPDGRVIEIAEKIRSSISGEKKPLALRWLDDHGHGSLVKRCFIVEFRMDQEDWAKRFEKQLEQSEVSLNVKRELNIHWQTLNAFVREKLRNGEELPLGLFNVFRQRFAKIKE